MDPEDSAHQVALHVLRSGPVHRGAVARALGLSPGSLTRLGRPLVDAGVLVETDPVTDPATRRPTRPLDVALDRHRFVGVCVRGSEVWAVCTDLRTTVLDQASAPLPDRSPEAVAGTVTDLVARLVGAGPPPAGTGIALDGRVDAAGRVLHADALGWRTPVDLGGLVAGRTGWPVRVDADLACLTRAEHWFGLGREHASFAVLTVGAGIGYGLVVDDRVVDTGLPQLGHLPLGGAGPRCPRGHRGCAGSLLTTTAVLAAAHVATGAPTTWAELLGGAVDGEVRPAGWSTTPPRRWAGWSAWCRRRRGCTRCCWAGTAPTWPWWATRACRPPWTSTATPGRARSRSPCATRTPSPGRGRPPGPRCSGSPRARAGSPRPDAVRRRSACPTPC
ncbi:ROK family protein [Klenkia terrae]|uniref:ROK family protein n=1 Tax=Klenkia terrae TaxID=1052259 RepID=UPI0036150C6B